MKVQRILAYVLICAMLSPVFQSAVGSEHIFIAATYRAENACSIYAGGVHYSIWLENGKIAYMVDKAVYTYRYAEHAISLQPLVLNNRVGVVWEDATTREIKSYIAWFNGEKLGKPVMLGYSRPCVISVEDELLAVSIRGDASVWVTRSSLNGKSLEMFQPGIQGRNASLAFYDGKFYMAISGRDSTGKGVHILASDNGEAWEKVKFWATEFLPTDIQFVVENGLAVKWVEDKGASLLHVRAGIEKNSYAETHEIKNSAHANANKPAPPLPQPLKNWTLVVFLDADNNLVNYGRDDVNEMEAVGSQDWMNIVVLFDGSSNGDSCLYYIQQDSNPSTITSPTIPLSQVNSSWTNELNMGAVSTVVDFARFVFDNFPAKYTFFDFWNHGGSWTGQCWDDTNGDNQEMAEFRQELDMLRNLTGRQVLWDIWTGDECLMASEAVTYQAKAFTNYTMNSEDSIAGDGWPYDLTFAWPKTYPNMTVVDFAYHAWDEYVKAYASQQLDTMAVFNNTLFDYEVVPLANNLAQKLRHRAGDFKTQIEYARSNAQAFEAAYGYGFDRDFYHFVDLLISQIPASSDAEIYNAAVALRDALTPNPSKAVMWEGHNSYTPNAHGIKCYIPTSYNSEFDTMMYPRETSWDEFIHAFIAGTNVPDVEPHVSITSPAEGGVIYQTGFTTVTGTADDSGDAGTVQYVQVKVDREDWQNATGTTTWSFALNATKLEPGVHRIWARSYDGKDYSNFACVNVTVALDPNLPDLTITSISISNSNPSEGQVVTINATVANVGTNWSANNVKVGFYVDSIGSTPFAVVNVGDIPAGTSRDAGAVFDTTGYAGTRTIYVVADPFYEIPELTDLNNTANAQITVSGYNLELTCTNNQSSVRAGESHIYQITVKNTGTLQDTIQLTINNPTNWSANFNDNKISNSPKLRLVNGYHNYTEITAELQAIASAHPDIAKLYSIGTSWEGRNIWCLKISDNVNVNETDEPDIAFYGLHHAREWISAEVPLYLAHYLVDNYNIDPRATYAVNEREIYIIPVVNPDGLQYSQYVGDWRKNRRNNGDGTYGVDLNRNYNGSQNGDANGAWGGAGASHSTGSDVYCGPEPFSEPETQAIRDFIISHHDQNNQLSISISYHSYGEVVYYPWGYAYSPEHGGSPVVTTPDVTYQKRIAQDIASRIITQSGSGTYDPMQSGDSYLTTGDTDDWTYGYSRYVWGNATFPFTIELATSFQPPASAITQICQSNLEGALYAIWRAGDKYFDAPTIQHTPLQNTSDTVNPYIVNATVSSNLTISSVKLYWKTTGNFNEVVMTNAGGDVYTASIPAQPAGTHIYYYIVAQNANATAVAPVYAPYQLYSFRIGSDVTVYNVTLMPGESRIVNFTVTAPPTAQPMEMANITVTGTSLGNSTKSRSVLTQTQVKSGYLLVDDTGGAYVNYYKTILDNIGILYDTVTSANADLTRYAVVLWVCKGDTTLSSAEESAIAAFLDAGGKLFISGEDIGYDIHSESFYANYLHAAYTADDSNINNLDGITGDPVSNGFAGIPITGSWPDVIAPADAYAVYSFYYTGSTYGAALRVDTGTYRVYYLACEYFEGTDTLANKATLMQRILTWLNLQHDIGIASMTPENGTVVQSGIGEVSAVVRNYGAQTCGSGQISFDIYGYPTASLNELMNETFENGLGNWSVQSPWGLTTTAHNGTYALTDSPSGNYGNSINITATYTNSIYLSGCQSVTLTFWQKYELESGWDYGYVEVSRDNGNTWEVLQNYTGTQSTWSKATIDLTTYASQSIMLRFRLKTDSSISYDGWYIDDISIEAIVMGTETYIETRNFSLPAIPAGSSVTVSFTMPFTLPAYRVVATVSTCVDEVSANNQYTTIFFVQTSEFVITLQKGLNFVSLPVTGNVDIATLLQQIDGRYNIVWYYSPAMNKWLTYSPYKASTLTVVNATMGIAINATTNCQIRLSQYVLAEHTTLYLKRGWNMVGINLNHTVTAGTLLSFLPSGSTIETFDTGLPYTVTAGQTLFAGKGYWIYVPEDTVVPL